MRAIEVGGRMIGPGHPLFVIAEISANHGNDLDRAIELVGIAASCGTDAVKVQTYTADTMTLDSDQPHFVVGPGNPWSGRRLHELYADAEMPWEWHRPLAEAAADNGILLFSTPFDATAVDFLVEQGSPALKIASFELTDLPLIARAASTGLPLIMSTGMATIDEIDDALATAQRAGDGGVALLRCNSAYPSPVEDMDLATIADMATRWEVPIGLSDHTLGHTSATVAVALGAHLLEKHFTVRRADGGPDSSFSLEPDELAELVDTVRAAERSVGRVRYGPSASDAQSLAFRRSLHVVRPVRAGTVLTETDVRSLRPAGGLAPRHLDEVIGRSVARDLEVGHQLAWDDLA